MDLLISMNCSTVFISVNCSIYHFQYVYFREIRIIIAQSLYFHIKKLDIEYEQEKIRNHSREQKEKIKLNRALEKLPYFEVPDGDWIFDGDRRVWHLVFKELKNS